MFTDFSEVFRGPLRNPLRGRFPSQRLSVRLPLIVLPLELSPMVEMAIWGSLVPHPAEAHQRNVNATKINVIATKICSGGRGVPRSLWASGFSGSWGSSGEEKQLAVPKLARNQARTFAQQKLLFGARRFARNLARNLRKILGLWFTARNIFTQISHLLRPQNSTPVFEPFFFVLPSCSSFFLSCHGLFPSSWTETRTSKRLRARRATRLQHSIQWDKKKWSWEKDASLTSSREITSSRTIHEGRHRNLNLQSNFSRISLSTANQLLLAWQEIICTDRESMSA